MEQFFEGLCDRIGLKRLDQNMFLRKKLDRIGVRPSHIAAVFICFYVFHLLTEHGTRWLSSFVGFFYPAYQTAKLVKALTDENCEEGRFWLKYWIVYGLLYITEIVFISLLERLPHYFIIKLIFIIWLVHQDTQGADVLYQKGVKAFLQKYEHKIDERLVRIQSLGSQEFITNTFQTIVKETVKTAVCA